MAPSRQYRSSRISERSKTFFSIIRSPEEQEGLALKAEKNLMNMLNSIAKKRVQHRLAQRAYRMSRNCIHVTSTC